MGYGPTPGSGPGTGNMHNGIKDETGNQHGTWLVTGYVPGLKRPHWDIQCVECGYERVIVGQRLRLTPPRCPHCKKAQERFCECGNPALPNRTICQPCRNVRQAEMRIKREARDSMEPVDLEHTPMLDIEPIRRWVQPYLNTGSYKELAAMCGIDGVGFARITQGKYERVQLDIVDKILCGFQAPGTLQELYPELYEFTDEQMREAELWAQG